MLSLREKNFCKEYLKDFNGEQACLRSGYKPGYATALIKKPEIKEYLRNKVEGVGITPDFVLTALKENALRCMEQKQNMKYDPLLDTWVPTPSATSTSENFYKYDPKAANTSLELLGKNMKMFTQVNENTNTNTDFIEYIKQVEDKDEW